MFLLLGPQHDTFTLLPPESLFTEWKHCPGRTGQQQIPARMYAIFNPIITYVNKIKLLHLCSTQLSWDYKPRHKSTKKCHRLLFNMGLGTRKSQLLILYLSPASCMAWTNHLGLSSHHSFSIPPSLDDSYLLCKDAARFKWLVFTNSCEDALTVPDLSHRNTLWRLPSTEKKQPAAKTF